MCVCVGYVTEFVVDFTIRLDRHRLMSRGFWLAQISFNNRDFHQNLYIFKLPMNLTDTYLLQSTKNKTTTFTNYYPGNVVISNIRPYAITQEERLFTRPQQVKYQPSKKRFLRQKIPLYSNQGCQITPRFLSQIWLTAWPPPLSGEKRVPPRVPNLNPPDLRFFKSAVFPPFRRGSI